MGNIWHCVRHRNFGFCLKETDRDEDRQTEKERERDRSVNLIELLLLAARRNGDDNYVMPVDYYSGA